LHAAQVCDGLVKGLKHPDWPLDPWEGLKRLVLMTAQCSASVSPGKMVRLALQA
jgi:DNA polymerase-3 subunit delta